MKTPACLRLVAGDERGKLQKQAQPRWLSPMLATLTAKHFSDPDWIFERKLDGVRCLAFTPELVAEIGFSEWTGDGKLRHPRFLGIRADKKATSVRRERPKS